MEAARANLRLVGDDAASSFPWPETGEVLSIRDAHYRIADMQDEIDGLTRLTKKQARENAALARRVAEDESADNHAQGKEIVALVERWKRVTGHPKSKTSGDRIKLVKARLKDGYSVEQLELAIDGIAAFPYVGTGGQRFAKGKPGQRHDRLGICLGGGEAVEKFAVLGHEARKAGWTVGGGMAGVILRGDCIEQMRTLDDASVDAIVTDPPYGLGFMGREWDSLPPGDEFAVEALRVLKPGGHLLAFGGTRTYHRLACAIEDAGFEIRDCLAWLYGSGFPKSLDVSKAIDKAAGAEREVVGRHIQSKQERKPGSSLKGSEDGSLAWQHDLTAPATPEAAQWQGWGTALKPAHEPIVLARKPPTGTVAGNVLAHGTGALNVDGTRVGMSDEDREAARVPQPQDGTGEIYGFAHGTGRNGETFEPAEDGRWPANVILDPEAAALLDEQSGEQRSGVAVRHRSGGNTFGGDNPKPAMDDVGYGDTGGASRFFFVSSAKADTLDPWLSSAPIATSPSSPDGPHTATAQSDAPTSRNPEATSAGSFPAPSTSATPSESSESAASDTPTTPSTGPKSSPESRRARRSPTNSPANDAGQSGPTDTTTTTPSRSTSAGSADDATSKGMSRNAAPGVPACPLDSGDKLRFRYTAKASRDERNAGLESFEAKPVRPSGSKFGEQTMWNGENGDPEWRAKNPNHPAANVHPTVKPIELMRWLCRLVTPPGGTVLDPFAGSGTTGCAAALEGFDFIGCEREDEYVAIAEARIAFWAQYPGADTEAVLASDDRRLRDEGQLDLLGEEAA